MHHGDGDGLLERETTLAGGLNSAQKVWVVLVSTAFSGVAAGVLEDRPSTRVCKTLVTAFRAANSSLKNFGSGSAGGIF